MRLLYSVLVCLLLVGCNSGSRNSNAPVTGTAFAPIPVEARRIAIVHSATSAARFYDEFIFNQTFAAMQQLARQAGLPYDLLSESDLTDASRLASYDAIVLPNVSNAPASIRDSMIAALVSAQQAGTGIISSGDLLAVDEQGQSFDDWDTAARQLLGLAPSSYIEGEATVVSISNADHPVTSGYAVNEQIADYARAWYADYQPVDGTIPVVLATATSDGQSYNAVVATNNTGRAVHFANEELLGDNLLWPALQWVVYGDRAPVALQLSRSDSIALARNDMDQTMYPALLDTTHVPLLDILRDWKRDFNFTGSHYIDIGNDPANGLYTDWSVSAPLMQQYIDLGIEIGTHSWTHPYFTAQLTDTQLEFEFNQAKNEISTQLNYPVTGGAIPGNTESLRVVENLNQWFEYFSGKANPFGLTQPAAVGKLRPDHNLIYFSLNTSPDFTLADFLNYPPDVAEQVWRDEIDAILSPHARQPLIHWLWHDYAPTTEIANGTYTREMFDNTVAYMHQRGAEFATLDDMQKRIRNFATAELTVGASATVEANIAGTGLGQFSLQMADGHSIKNVANWYAYSDDKVFLPENGGQFSIVSGANPDAVTRISSLPMRAKLLGLNGDGATLTFEFSGSGEVTVTLNPQLVGNYVVSGADSIIENEDTLVLAFNNEATHSVSIDYNTAPNVEPVAVNQSVTTGAGQSIDITLVATDADNESLEYSIITQPSNGVLNGTAPNVLYTPNSDYTGMDTFSFSASDGVAQSNVATVAVEVTATPIPNLPPVANSLAVQTLIDTPVELMLGGSDNEGRSLSYNLLTPPANGTLNGVAPALGYTPASGYTGVDQFTFLVSDGTNDSEPATVTVNVVAQLPPVNGTRSNQLGNESVALDGSLAEWNAVTSFGVDADDANNANDAIDWQEAWVAHDNDYLYIAYQTYEATSLTWGHGVYLDTDTSGLTGFRGFGSELSIGADFLLEGQSLFRYGPDADGTSWSWEFVASVDAGNSGNTSEFAIALADLGDPVNLRLVLRGNSAATGGSTLDNFPDDAANPLAVNLQRHFSYSVNANVQIDNIAPDASPQSLQLSSNAAVSILLTGSDLNADPLSYAIESGPTHGTLSGEAPALVYTPDNDYQGADSFTFSVSDGSLQSNPAQVSLEIVSLPSANVAPVANSQTLAVLNTGSLPISLAASDANGDVLDFELIDQPQNGSLAGTGADFVYTPASNFIGIDTIVFRASDGSLNSNVATIRISVSSAVENSAPVANSAALVTTFETAIATTLTASDADNQALSYTIVDQPQLGVLTGTAPALTYNPFDGATGNDSFTFSVSDGAADSNIATISVMVLAQNQPDQPPVAIGLNLAGIENQPLAVTLAGRDPEGADLSYELLSAPQFGTLSGIAPDLSYTPGTNAIGLDSFSYRVSDGVSQSTSAVVTLDIGANNASATTSNPATEINIDGALTDWHGLRSSGIDADDIFGPDNPLDIRGTWVAHDSENFYLAARNDGPFLLGWGSQWLLDTDANPATGFSGFAGEYPLGAEYLIEGSSIHRYTGTGNDWSWSYQGTSNVAIAGDVLEMAIARNLLDDATDLQMFLIANNAPFGGSAVDYFPQAALDAAQPQAVRVISYSAILAPVEQDMSATYRATFNSSWSAATHPVNFPSSDPHFSGLVGATHSDQLVLWASGELASAAVEQVAETGASDLLLADIQNAITAGTALAEITGGGIAQSPGSVSVEFSVARNYPLVTLLSMLAPSPDWFVGINAQSMLDSNGAFIENLSVDLRLYDSGTDDGERFFADDAQTTPPQPITPLTSSAGDTDFVNGLPAIGQLVFERVRQ